MGKRANIRATARATQTLVGHAERDELVSRGLLPPSASVADAQAMLRRLAREAEAERRAAVRREQVASASPKTSLLVGAALVAVLVIVSVATGSTVWWVITVVVGLASVVGLVSSCSDADARDAAARRAGGGGSTPR